MTSFEQQRQYVIKAVLASLIIVPSALAEHARIHFSTTGELGVGDIVYDGGSPVRAMIEHNGGVLTAFANCGPFQSQPAQAACIHWSPNGQPAQAACIHWSPNEQGLGAGQREYGGSSPVTAMTAYNSGVLTAFANCGPFQSQPAEPACIHWSPNGQGLGAGPRVYGGSSFVTAMLGHGNGVLTAFTGLPEIQNPNFCPLESQCIGVVLMCRKGRTAPGANCVQDGPPEPCGVCLGFSFR
jgi:hypothetical protein